MNAPIHIVCPTCHAVNRIDPERLGESPRCGKCHQPATSATPVTLDAATFDRHTGRSDIPVLVDFWAPWCGPCKMMAPAFESAAARLAPAVRCARLDTETAPDIANRFAIRSIPTLVLFRGGREIARQAGVMGAEDIVHWVRTQP